MLPMLSFSGRETEKSPGIDSSIFNTPVRQLALVYQITFAAREAAVLYSIEIINAITRIIMYSK